MNPTPISRMQAATSSGDRSIRAPAASSTSALPLAPDAARLPCYAMFPPAPATTKAAAVEILNVPIPSPPVPQVSIKGLRSMCTRAASSRITLAAAAISSMVSPFILRAIRIPAICACVASPAMMSPMTSCMSSKLRFCPSTSLRIADLISTRNQAGAADCTKKLRSRSCPKSVKIDSGWN